MSQVENKIRLDDCLTKEYCKYYIMYVDILDEVSELKQYIKQLECDLLGETQAIRLKDME